MKKFDKTYVLLEEMKHDSYFPDFLVDKIEERIVPMIHLLEDGETDCTIIQEKLDQITLSINGLQEEFEENDSEIETVARDSIAKTVEDILQWFGISIDIETALHERDW